MIEKLIEKFYSAASMQRWNDHIRPVEFIELDKQAHKMVIAYVLAKMEDDRRKDIGQDPIKWLDLIEGFIFEFLQRIVLTDIKPPVFHKILAEKKNELNKHVLKELKPVLEDLNNQEFEQKFENFLSNSPINIETKILRAAHYLATNWEFKIIYKTAPYIYGIERRKEKIENKIEDHYDLIGVQKILLGKKSYGFVDLCGQLRFQKRWAQSPRIPETSVLGHMLIVAMTSYFCTITMKDSPCDKRIYNNFFAGLFHDLPEVLTKDIISPVKKSVSELDEIIKECETNLIDLKLLELLPKQWHMEIKYFTENEFENRITGNNKLSKISFKELNSKFNEDKFSPIDGELIYACDKLAAFVEAKLSIRHGITSKALENGLESIYNEFKDKKISGTDFGLLFDNLSDLIDN